MAMSLQSVVGSARAGAAVPSISADTPTPAAAVSVAIALIGVFLVITVNLPSFSAVQRHCPARWLDFLSLFCEETV